MQWQTSSARNSPPGRNEERLEHIAYLLEEILAELKSR